jgi:Flp pilus assembly protein TadG
MLFPLLIIVGGTLDYARTARVKSMLQSAADGAALLGAQVIGRGGSVESMNARVASYLSAAMGVYGFTSPDPVVNTDRTEVCVTAYSDVPTTVLKLIHRSAMQAGATSCSKAGGTDYEIALVLDTTGSMSGGTGGTTKIAALRSAAKAFVDHMYSAAPTRTKMSVVPFSAAVRLDPTTYRNAAWVDKTGASSWHWKSPLFIKDPAVASSRFALYAHLKSVRSTWDWAGCFESLPYPYNVQDTTPTAANPDTLLVPMLAPDEPDATYRDKRGKTKYNPQSYANNYLDDSGGVCTGSLPNDTDPEDERLRQGRVCKYKTGRTEGSGPGPNQSCNSEPLMRMTTSDAVLKTKIDGLDANGNTNVFEGMVWGWRTISPKGPFQDGRSYTAANNKKVIVLMTDGENVWNEKKNQINDSEYGPMGYYTVADDRLPHNWQEVNSASKSRNALDAVLKETCANARSAGVVVYTIGLSVKGDELDSQAKKLLQDCAGSATRAFIASDAAQLTTAFKDIGNGIADLRLSR